MSDSLRPQKLQHSKLPGPSLSAGVCSDSCPLYRWWLPTSHPLSTPSPPAFNLLQYQSLFQWVSSSHQAARVLELQLQHQSLQQIIQFSHSVASHSLQPHGLQHTKPPCPWASPRVYSNSCPLSQWCHPTILSSVVPFSSCLQSFPASGSFQMSQFFAWCGQSIGVLASTSVLPMNI